MTIEDWEGLVTELRRHPAFAKHPFFYLVEGISPLGTFQRIEPSDGRFELSPNSIYTLQIRTHAFQEMGDETPCWLFVDGDEKALSFSTPSRFAIDSPYDDKTIHFKTASVPHPVDSALTFLSQRSSLDRPDKDKSTLDFDVLIRTKSDRWELAWKGAIVGAVISFQGMFLVWANPGIQDKGWAIISVLLLGVAAGLSASFGLRKL